MSSVYCNIYSFREPLNTVFTHLLLYFAEPEQRTVSSKLTEAKNP